jgi:hypothetical protein
VYLLRKRTRERFSLSDTIECYRHAGKAYNHLRFELFVHDVQKEEKFGRSGSFSEISSGVCLSVVYLVYATSDDIHVGFVVALNCVSL